jgi:hypothetical protein
MRRDTTQPRGASPPVASGGDLPGIPSAVDARGGGPTCQRSGGRGGHHGTGPSRPQPQPRGAELVEHVPPRPVASPITPSRVLGTAAARTTEQLLRGCGSRRWKSSGTCSSFLPWWLSGWLSSTCWPAGAETALTRRGRATAKPEPHRAHPVFPGGRACRARGSVRPGDPPAYGWYGCIGYRPRTFTAATARHSRAPAAKIGNPRRSGRPSSTTVPSR